MTEEKVVTEGFGLIDAFLIEARSIGGLSSSPVFLNLGCSRMIGGKLKWATGGKTIFYLMGLVHGHYDVEQSDIDDVEADNSSNLSTQQVNTGIAIVVSFHSIKAVIDSVEES